MFNVTSRVAYAEQAIAQLLRNMIDLTARVVKLEQQQWLQAGTAGGGGGGGNTFFVANNITLAAGTGTWPTITPGSTTADVYHESSGGLVIDTSAATIYNFGPDAADATKRQYLASNGDGTFTLVGQSCSAG